MLTDMIIDTCVLGILVSDGYSCSQVYGMYTQVYLFVECLLPHGNVLMLVYAALHKCLIQIRIVYARFTIIQFDPVQTIY